MRRDDIAELYQFRLELEIIRQHAEAKREEQRMAMEARRDRDFFAAIGDMIRNRREDRSERSERSERWDR